MNDANPNNSAHEREVTLLFADMRGFTELAGSLECDPLACELQSHVMDCLTEAVLAHDGFVVDYCGDGLVAMWNAPDPQVDHADRACSAALKMLDTLPVVADDWMVVIQRVLQLGIGVHTGVMQVGNAGSSLQAKYGPRGINVNLASRVEAATKELLVPFVATQSTVEQLSKRFIANRICRATMPGLQQPVDLYSIQSSPMDGRLQTAWHVYDNALRQFELGQYRDAISTLDTINTGPPQLPLTFLFDRAQCELGRQERRRSTDKPAVLPGGVISIRVK